MEGLGINVNFLLSQIVNFSILFVALYFLLWKPLLKTLDTRRQRIQEGMDKAEQVDEELVRAQDAYSQKMAEAESEAERIKAQARDAAHQEHLQVLEEAREQASGILAEAQMQIDLERQEMLREFRGQVGALSIAAAQKILGETLDERHQTALVQSFFSGIREGKISVLESADLAGDAAIVTSALPLAEGEQQQYRGVLADRLGDNVAVSFRTDPSILGGVIVRAGDRVVDDSVAGRLEALRTQLDTG